MAEFSCDVIVDTALGTLEFLSVDVVVVDELFEVVTTDVFDTDWVVAEVVVLGGGGAGFFAKLLISSDSSSLFELACFSFAFDVAILFSLLSWMYLTK